jgi:hypothetical protein
VLLTQLLSFGNHSVLLLAIQVAIGGAVYILADGYSVASSELRPAESLL